MSAPAESVAAVQKALGCWFEDTVAGVFCNKHHCYADQRHESIDVCEVAVAAADAAVQAARPSIERAAKAEALREVANAWTQHEWSNVLLPPPREGIIPLAYAQLMGDWLRARADRTEAQP